MCLERHPSNAAVSSFPACTLLGVLSSVSFKKSWLAWKGKSLHRQKTRTKTEMIEMICSITGSLPAKALRKCLMYQTAFQKQQEAGSHPKEGLGRFLTHGRRPTLGKANLAPSEDDDDTNLAQFANRARQTTPKTWASMVTKATRASKHFLQSIQNPSPSPHLYNLLKPNRHGTKLQSPVFCL